jgi:Ala-tRNA(Pro) deacylase
MPINPKLLAFMTASGARYKVFPHHLEYTSQQVAEASHVPGRGLVKAVVLRDAESSYLVAALPASMNVDLERLEQLTGRRKLALASEHELRLLFPDCQIGAAPPFGHLYGIAVIVDPCLLDGPEIYFQAGNHREVVSMSRDEFRLLARPTCASECFHAALVDTHPLHETHAATS